MRRYYIEHRTIYRYSEPVRFGLHRLVLRPREGHDVTVVKHQLEIQPSARLFWLTDLFGNSIAIAEIPEPATSLEIVNKVIIERVGGPSDEAPPLITRESKITLPVAYPQMEQSVVSGYIHAVYPEEQSGVHEWAAQQIKGEVADMSAYEIVAHLNRCIHTQIRYRRREERGVQSPATTLSFSAGSCRDMANLLMEACRSLGLAARFASGYLDAAAANAGRGSTHAWVEVYLPDNGWCGFDPTVGGPISPKHVTLGVSSHPRGVMPISGIYDGSPGCYLGMDVAVTIRQSYDDDKLVEGNRSIVCLS
ncbi:Transglutaminase-like enzyme, putative cysteine protease [Prosthecobacter debontii]|uniref:Transglutaminase-like enzyme, putative cysteine protease n=1 Tax=Prosthecobacter debontii TaxID=48467 RepID=A0A1T4WY79_9BACT|nr:transglutaminase family protein [Prosthecobacter debontii]SKA82310.1 Transglutaminase-like enzyme, putative cysteine protease [Prosthecobacter debontii]